MAYYRYQVVSVGMWRGKIKRWNTTLHMWSSGYTTQIHDLFQKSGWKESGDVLGACSGGVAMIKCYNPTGGLPISQTVYFDWQTPSTWIPYTGEFWSDVPAATPIDASGESALIIQGRMPALSKLGKPVFTRKYLHAIPSRTSAAFTDPDVLAATAAKFKAAWTPAYMANAAGVTPSSVDALAWYGNHQRRRGRRKTKKAVATQSFSSGVVAGAGAQASGGESFR